MTDTKIIGRPRGRPRAFDLDSALATAQRLFHERGYDGVSLATLTEALGISPPSFYAAFGSKAELFDQVLARYAGSALPLDDILQDGRAIPEALTELLACAARVYAANPAEAGCLVIEAARSSLVGGCSGTARRYHVATRERIAEFVSRENAALADQLADFVDVTLSGLSASAREGWPEARLQQVVTIASSAIDAAWHSPAQ